MGKVKELQQYGGAYARDTCLSYAGPSSDYKYFITFLRPQHSAQHLLHADGASAPAPSM